MSFQQRLSNNTGGLKDVDVDTPRFSLNAADLSAIPAEDFGEQTNPLARDSEDKQGLRQSLLPEHAESGGAASMISDPMANKAALEGEGWFTQLVYTFFCIEWRPKVFDRAMPLAPQM